MPSPYVSVLARQLEQLLRAKQWRCQVRRFTIEAVEPALDPIEHTWLAGRASDINANDVMQTRPTRIIVEDHAPTSEIDRLRKIETGLQRPIDVTTMTYFVDLLWGARAAGKRAMRDAELLELPYEELSPRSNADERHVPQILSMNGTEVIDHRLFDTTLTTPNSTLAILADAGLGKTELLRWHEWRYAANYEAACSRRSPVPPPVALRVPLRGLRAFSLEAVARHLVQGDQGISLPPLEKITNGEVLAQLLRLDRLMLLLDGLDELDVTREVLEDGLRAFRNVAMEGGRVVFATRAGHFASAASVHSRFQLDEIAHIIPMTRAAGHRLLANYGASERRANDVLRSLAPSPAQGIPLFLLMALDVGLSGKLEPNIAESKTRVLLELLRLFCERDEKRLGVPSDVQMELLTALAHWINLQGDMAEAEALEQLGLDPDDREATVITNPHALLTRKSNGIIEFKYPQFRAIFTAKALTEDWVGLGFEAIAEDLRSVKLDEATVEYLARLIDEDRLGVAWRTASTVPDLRKFPLVRRNVLAIAVAKLDDLAQADSPQVRSAVLRRILQSADLSGVNFAGVTIERVDLRDWTLVALHGRGGSLLYCPNLRLAKTDESLATLDSLDGCEAGTAESTAEKIENGSMRLDKMLRAWRAKGANVLQSERRVATTPDSAGWAEVRRLGLVKQARHYRGEKYWQLTEEGRQLLHAFVATEQARNRESAVAELLEREGVLKELVVELGRSYKG
jgi:hypothetical protein